MKGRYFLFASVVVTLVFIGVACGLAGGAVPSGDDPPPGPAPAPESFTVNLSSQGFTYDKNVITVPAGATVTVLFENKGPAPHNLAIYKDSTAAELIFRGETIGGSQKVTYRFTAPSSPGTYFFRCDLHPSSMTGSFVVQ